MNWIKKANKQLIEKDQQTTGIILDHGSAPRKRSSSSMVSNACTLVPTVFRWHGKMEFKCHLHFLFSHDTEKQILFFVFALLWKTDMNFSSRFSFSHHFEKRIWISFLHYLLLKNRLEFRLSFLHEFEKWINAPVIWNSPPPSPRGWPG